MPYLQRRAGALGGTTRAGRKSRSHPRAGVDAPRTVGGCTRRQGSDEALRARVSGGGSLATARGGAASAASPLLLVRADPRDLEALLVLPWRADQRSQSLGR